MTDKLNHNPETGSLDHIFTAGPISLDGYNNQVHIVPNIVIQLSSYEYDMFYMLASRESVTLTFEQIYKSVWENDDGNDRRKEAKDVLDSLVDKLNSSGTQFAWFDVCEKGYTFRTKWAHNFSSWSE